MTISPLDIATDLLYNVGMLNTKAAGALSHPAAMPRTEVTNVADRNDTRDAVRNIDIVIDGEDWRGAKATCQAVVETARAMFPAALSIRAGVIDPENGSRQWLAHSFATTTGGAE